MTIFSHYLIWSFSSFNCMNDSVSHHTFFGLFVWKTLFSLLFVGSESVLFSTITLTHLSECFAYNTCWMNLDWRSNTNYYYVRYNVIKSKQELPSNILQGFVGKRRKVLYARGYLSWVLKDPCDFPSRDLNYRGRR